MILSFNEGIVMDKNNDDAAIACTLNDAEFRERRALARRTILPKISNHHRTSNGLTLSFVDSAETRADVEKFVALEQGCCGFLTFRLDPKPASSNDVFGLAITGPVGATEFIDMFVRHIEGEEAGTDIQNAN